MRINYPRHAYELVGADPLAIEIAVGKIKMPLRVVRTPFEFYGFPPALVPIWTDSSGPSYVGYWKHWFIPRKPTIVESSVEDGFRVSEYARSIKQAAYIVAAQYIVINGSVDDELLQFAYAVGLDHIRQLAKIVEVHGEELSALQQLPEFGSNRSITGSSSDLIPHNGALPHEGMEISPATLRTVCALELTADFQEQLHSEPDVPAWLVATDQAPVFSRCLEQDDLRAAWLSLNSTGWTFPEARNAMQTLAERSHDPQFAEFAKIWLSCPHEAVCGGY
jgi:hypothetical protein